MVRESSLVLLSIVLSACAPVPGGGMQNRDTTTIHNAEATHVWAFQKDQAGNDYVLYCDSGWPASNHPLCVRYPNSYAQEGAPATTAPVTVQLVQPATPAPAPKYADPSTPH